MLFEDSVDPGSFRVVDFVSGKKCKPLPKYPLRLIGEPFMMDDSVGLLDNRPVVCGGSVEESVLPIRKPVAACYIHDQMSESWKYLTSLKTARSHHSTTTLKDRIWLSDGQDIKHGRLNTSEFVFPNGTVQQGPKLPKHVLLLDLLDGRYMILPAWSKDVYIYTSKNDSIVKAPPLLGKYGANTATLFHSQLHNNRSVVMTTDHEFMLQVWDYTVSSSVWEECK